MRAESFDVELAGDVVTSDVTASDTARLFDELADEVDNDPDTTYTAADLYSATERLRTSLARKLAAADVIRGRPKSRLGKRLVRLR